MREHAAHDTVPTNCHNDAHARALGSKHTGLPTHNAPLRNVHHSENGSIYGTRRAVLQDDTSRERVEGLLRGFAENDGDILLRDGAGRADTVRQTTVISADDETFGFGVETADGEESGPGFGREGELDLAHPCGEAVAAWEDVYAGLREVSWS